MASKASLTFAVSVGDVLFDVFVDAVTEMILG